MYAKLTNAVDLYRGNPIYINPDHVSAVYEVAKSPGGSLVTIIYGGFQGLAWEVEESLSDAVAILNSATAGSTVKSAVTPKVVAQPAVVELTAAVTESVAVVAKPKKAAATKKKVTATVDSK